MALIPWGHVAPVEGPVNRCNYHVHAAPCMLPSCATTHMDLKRQPFPVHKRRPSVTGAPYLRQGLRPPTHSLQPGRHTTGRDLLPPSSVRCSAAAKPAALSGQLPSSIGSDRHSAAAAGRSAIYHCLTRCYQRLPPPLLLPTALSVNVRQLAPGLLLARLPVLARPRPHGARLRGQLRGLLGAEHNLRMCMHACVSARVR